MTRLKFDYGKVILH